MGLSNMRVARPFRANVVMGISHPGLRCAPPWAIIARRFAAEDDIMVRHFAAEDDIKANLPCTNKGDALGLENISPLAYKTGQYH
jgi:hypothetical protein